MGFRRLTLRLTAAAVFGVLLVGTTAISAQAKPAPPGPGNSPSAKACSNGGWQNLVTSSGATFANQDACVAYAAHGGALAPKVAATLVISPDSPQTATFDNPVCGPYTATGSGLKPDSFVYFTYLDGTLDPQTVGRVASDGTVVAPTSVGGPAQFVFGPVQPDRFTTVTATAHLIGTAADGTAITSNAVSCTIFSI
jgi:hypothetical protein